MMRILPLMLLWAAVGVPSLAHSSSEATVSGRTQTPKEAAIDLVRKMGTEAIDALTDKSLNGAQVRERFEEIFSRAFAVESIAIFTLGRHQQGATLQERQEFLKLFKKNVADVYATRFQNYNRESFQVVTAREGNKEGNYRVLSKIVSPNGATVNVDWKVTLTPGGPKITDVVVENVSMSVTQRSDFDATIQHNGGTVSDLNRLLQAKLERQANEGCPPPAEDA